MYVRSSEGTAKRNWRRNKYVREMKLPKTRPWRQDVHGELLVGILLRPSTHGPGHADLAFPVGLEPLRNNRPAKQRSTVTSATAADVVNIARDINSVAPRVCVCVCVCICVYVCASLILSLCTTFTRFIYPLLIQLLLFSSLSL